MVIRTASKVPEYVLCIDTSGNPGVGKAFAVGCLWFKQQNLQALGKQLQTIREVHGCESHVHFSELGREGQRESVARDWVRFFLKSLTFQARGNILVIPNDGFDLGHYGGNRDIALNRTTKSCVLGAITRMTPELGMLRIRAHIDGGDASDPSTRNICEYIQRAISFASDVRTTMPNVLNVSAEAVRKKPLGGRGTELRALQDLVALTDVLAGCSRLFFEPASDHSIKNVISKILRERTRLASVSGRRGSPIEVQVLKFPYRSFVDLDCYLLN